MVNFFNVINVVTQLVKNALTTQEHEKIKTLTEEGTTETVSLQEVESLEVKNGVIIKINKTQ